MKKIPNKLVVRREAIRVLRTLENNDLARVLGGALDASGDPQTGVNCPEIALGPVTLR